MANGGDCKNLNSINEPNEVPLNSQNADFDEALAGTNLDRRLFEDRDGHINEAHVALLDTACTACLHSKKWRQAYSLTLPPGYQCTATSSKKTIHFANGESESRMVVWRIPIFLQGVAGEVHSAELDAGATPLLFSIPAMQALDMVLCMKDLKVGIRALDLEMPMQVTRSKHIALNIAFDPAVGTREDRQAGGQPRAHSDAGDFVAYFVDEARLPILHQCAPPVEAEAFWNRGKAAPNLGPRGVHTNDKVGELKQRRVDELQRAARKHQLRDQRSWSALRRDFTMAEQHATRGFKDTVIFEPFAGTFGITRVAAEEFGWTCSQPMDLLDGYDLLSGAGRQLVKQVLAEHRPYLVVLASDCRIWSPLTNLSPEQAWEQLRQGVGRRALQLVRWICQVQDRAGRYYLVENHVVPSPGSLRASSASCWRMRAASSFMATSVVLGRETLRAKGPFGRGPAGLATRSPS